MKYLVGSSGLPNMENAVTTTTVEVVNYACQKFMLIHVLLKIVIINFMQINYL